MLSYWIIEIVYKKYNVILSPGMTRIIWYLLLYLLLLLFFFLLILSWKNDYSLSLSRFYILPCNSTLVWWIIVFFKTLFWVNMYWCCIFEFLITSSLSTFYSFCLNFFFFELILSYFGSDNWIWIRNLKLKNLVVKKKKKKQKQKQK